MTRLPYFFVIILFLLLTSQRLLAQHQGERELFVGYGLASSFLIRDVVSDLHYAENSNPNAGDPVLKNKTTTGTFHFGYRFAIIERLTLSATFAYETVSDDIYYSDIYIGNRKNDYYTIALGGQYHYIAKPRFQMYSGLEAGVSFAKHTVYPDASFKMDPFKENEGLFAYQVTAAGVSFGRSLGLFAELGYGYKGFAVAGLFFRATR